MFRGKRKSAVTENKNLKISFRSTVLEGLRMFCIGSHQRKSSLYNNASVCTHPAYSLSALSCTIARVLASSELE